SSIMANDNNAPVRRTITAPVMHDHGPSPAKVLVVGAGSTFVNGAVIGALVLVSWVLGLTLPDKAQAKANTQNVDKETVVEDTPKEFDLTNPDVGIDDSVALNYNVDRIEEVSVPGKVDVTQNVGLQNAPEAPPTNVPLPAGSNGGAGGARAAATPAARRRARGTSGGAR